MEILELKSISEIENSLNIGFKSKCELAGES